MEWELATAPRLKKAIDAGKLCILPFGSQEKHGEHLPIGTDMLLCYEIVRRAAEITGDVVFPKYYFAQVNEGRPYPGAVAIDPALVMPCLQSVVDEIGRNGFKKIVICNGHGGNQGLIRYFMKSQNHRETDYTIYQCSYAATGENIEAAHQILGEGGGHAGAWETSLMLGLFGEESIDRAAITGAGEKHARHNMTVGSTQADWFAAYPEYLAGDPNKASVEKGRKLERIHIENLVKYLNDVRDDTLAPELRREFFKKSRNP